MSEHTPGPWSFTQSEIVMAQWGVGCDLFCGAVTSGRQVVCLAASDGMVGSEMVANAALIAAAPDLLAALRTVLDENDKWADPQWKGSPVEVAGRAAVAKASGRDGGGS